MSILSAITSSIVSTIRSVVAKTEEPKPSNKARGRFPRWQQAATSREAGRGVRPQALPEGEPQPSSAANSVRPRALPEGERKAYTKNAAGHFVCPHCGETKEKQNTMFYHMQTHEGKLPYECNVCKKAFVQKQELLLHKQRRHAHELKGSADMVVCPFDDCEFEDIRKGNVRIHCIRMHGREYISDDMIKRTGTQWSCALCDYNCGSQAGLYYHLSSCLFEYGIIPPNSELAKTMEAL